MIKKACGLMALLGLIVCSVGCGQSDKPELALVNGSISKNGQPFTNALIEFLPEGKGGASYGTSDSNGNFTLSYTTGEPGAAIGKHVVKVTGGQVVGASNLPPAPAVTDESAETFAPISDPEKATKRSAGPPPPVTLAAVVSSASPNTVQLVVP